MSIYAVIGAGHGLIPGDLLFGGEYFHSDDQGAQFRFQVYDEYGGDKGKVFLPSSWVRENVRLSIHEPGRDHSPRERELVEALKHGRRRDQGTGSVEVRPAHDDVEILELTNAIALHLFFGRTEPDARIDEAFESFKADLARLYVDYRRHKHGALSIDTIEREHERDLERSYRATLKAQFSGGSDLKDRYALKQNEVLKKLDTKVVDLGAGGRSSWIAALAALTILRKMLRGEQLPEVAHFPSDSVSNVFTRIDWNGAPSGLWVHNTKNKAGVGATRIISFLRDKEIDFAIPHDDIRDREGELKILDLSYDDVTTLLFAVRDGVFGRSDANLARFVISLVEGGRYVDIERSVWADVLVKSLKPSGREKPPLVRIKVPAHSVCLNLLAILFLTEPRHAMPCWVGNLDALRCVERGLISFDQLLRLKMDFPLRNEAPFYELVRESNHPIGSLLPSNNTAKFLLPPELRHTRRLKEMIMPTFELLFKYGTSLADFVRLLPALEEAFFDSYELEPWFIEALDYNDNHDPTWDGWISFRAKKNKERRKIIDPLKKKLDPDKETAKAALIMARKLTFAAPIVKTLLMRVLLLSRR
ncbi:hypothetical protein WMF38_14905 [Sorangium sp. So ce118]